MSRGWFVVAACLLAGCGSCGSGRVPGPGDAGVAPPPLGATTAPARLPPPRAKLRMTAGGASDDARDALRGGERVTTAASAPLFVDFRDGATVRVEPGSKTVVGRDSPAALLLLDGSVMATLPPQGSSTRPELRIATRHAVVVVPGSGSVFVGVGEQGDAWVAAIAGTAEVETGELDDAGAVTRTPLVAGQSVRVLADGVAAPVTGPPSEDLARSTWERLRGEFGRGRASAPTIEDATRRVDESIAKIDALLADVERVRVLERAATGDPAKLAESQRGLIEIGQALFRVRRALRTRWERAQTLARAAGDAPTPAADALDALRSRVRHALDDDPEADDGAPAGVP